jgi:DNA-binding NtrC family response regulator
VILLVDDDPALAARLQQWLGPGRPLLAAADRDAAMAVLEARPVAVALCSERQGGRDSGLYLLDEIRRRYPLTQLVLMSEGVDEALLAFAINEVGVLKYLRKPLDGAQARRALDEALRHHAQAVEIERLRAGHRQLAQRVRGLPHRLRQYHRGVRLVMRHGRALALASAAALVALQVMFLGTGAIVLVALYLLKRALGIDLLEDLHLQDLLGA